jgi:hypothetical protein
MTIPDAATTGSIEHFALAVAGSLVLILAAICWYFIRDRLQFSMKEREVLYKKLAEGSERMKSTDQTVAVLQERCPDKDFMRNLDVRLIGVEAKLDHMGSLLAKLVEIRNVSN